MARAQLLLPVGLTVFCLVAAHAAGQSSTWEYRLSGGTSSYGRLEARSSSTGSWGTVCDDSFGSNDATVACRSLGLSTTTVSYRTASGTTERGTTSQSIVMDDLACTGSESTLDQCTRASSHNCAHSEDVLVGCGVSSIPSLTATWEYRLVGGTSTYGRLEARSSSTASWGTVCDDSFGSNDARVACRSLGLSTTTYTYRTASGTSERGASTQGIVMDDLACTGSESTLDQCTRSSSHNCGHSEDVLVGCGVSTIPSLSSTPAPPTTTSAPWEYRLVGGTSTYGRLELRPTANDPWGTICDNSFTSNDARAACNALGLTTTTFGYRTVTASEQGSSSQPIWFGYLYCTTTDTRLEYCSRGSNSSCTHSEDVMLSCGSSSVPSNEPRWDYRLVGGGSTWGRLEVRPNANAAWGTVCDDSFTSNDARAACTALGMSSTFTGYRTATTSEQGAATQPIWFGNLYCSSSDTRLEVCSHGGNASCFHYEDVMLSCGSSTVPGSGTSATPSPPATGSSAWEYRLVGGATSNYGRLEVRPSASFSWGTVCDDSFGMSDATVACRSLGLSTTMVAYRTASGSSEQGSLSQVIRMDDLACSGTEARLDLCARASTENCMHSEDVVLGCGMSSVPSLSATNPPPAPGPTSAPWQYRLVGGSTTHGRLEVRQNSSAEWGTVCDDSFGVADATVACRALGIPVSLAGYRTVNTEEQGNASQPIWFANLYCTSSTARLEDCNRGTTSGCGHNEDVIVDCSGSTAGWSSSIPALTSTTAAPPPAPWLYRLAGGSSTHGRLEVRRNASVPWGAVCDDEFDENDAIVACRSLGLSTSPVAFRSPTYTSELANISFEMDDLACSGSEEYLDRCPRAVNHNCFSPETVLIGCGRTSVPEVSPAFGPSVLAAALAAVLVMVFAA